jgi:hypothetical protein
VILTREEKQFVKQWQQAMHGGNESARCFSVSAGSDRRAQRAVCERSEQKKKKRAERAGVEEASGASRRGERERSEQKRGKRAGRAPGERSEQMDYHT